VSSSSDHYSDKYTVVSDSLSSPQSSSFQTDDLGLLLEVAGLELSLSGEDFKSSSTLLQCFDEVLSTDFHSSSNSS